MIKSSIVGIGFQRKGQYIIIKKNNNLDNVRIIPVGCYAF